MRFGRMSKITTDPKLRILRGLAWMGCLISLTLCYTLISSWISVEVWEIQCFNTVMVYKRTTTIWRNGIVVHLVFLTHWGGVTHICVSKLTIIGSDNGLSPGRRQAIIWTNAGILLIRPLGHTGPSSCPASPCYHCGISSSSLMIAMENGRWIILIFSLFLTSFGLKIILTINLGLLIMFSDISTIIIHWYD